MLRKFFFINMFLFFLSLCFPLNFTPAALAVDTGKVIGEGARKCTDYLKAKGRKQNKFIVWVQGYFSAYNAIAPDITDLLGDKDWEWVRKRLKAHCEAEPGQYFNEAVIAMTVELHPQGIVLNSKCEDDKKPK